VVQKLPPSCASRGFCACIPGNGRYRRHVVVSPNGKIYHDTTTNWAPRVGLAYRATANLSRSRGFGIYYDNWAAVTPDVADYEGSWPDVGQQLANNLNVPTQASPRPRHRPKSFRGWRRRFPGAHTVPAGAVVLRSLQQESLFAAVEFRSCQANLNSSTTVNIDYVGSGSRRST